MLPIEVFQQLTEEEKRKYHRETRKAEGLSDLLYFSKELMGSSDIEEGVHGELIKRLMGDSRKKLILLPRGSFKSSISTICWPIWRFLRNPDIRILVDSEVLENSQRFLNQMHTHLIKPSFQEMFGNLLDSKERITAREFTINTRVSKQLKEPTVYATGIGTVNVGMHYDLIIADDLHSEKNVGTKDQIDKVIAHYRLLLSLLEPNGQLVIIGTRWHFADLYDYILEEEAEGWDIYIEKAIRKDGSLFFPNRLTKEFLDEMRRAQSAYLFSCQYQNEPVSEETQAFRKEYFKYWGNEAEPYPSQDNSRILLNLYLIIDRAFSTKEAADYTGICVAGVSSSNNIYVLEAERKKCGLQALTDRVDQLMDKYGSSRFRKVCIETINFEETSQFFQERMRKSNKFYILERLVPQGKMSKEGRIREGLQARYANGSVFHRKRMIDLEDELMRFPNGTHDDLIDALAWLPMLMMAPADQAYEGDNFCTYEPSIFGRVN
jgi:predicted phage terminase large subunit-like protein